MMKKYLPKFIAILSILAPKVAARVAMKYFATPVRIARPASEMEMFHLSKQYFLKSGCAAFEWGESSSPLVLLIHGWNGRGTQISPFAKSLIANGFRVVALDGPGHGASPGNWTTPTHFANFVIESQQELAPEGAHSLIAHSFGGGCCVLAATRGLKIKSLVLIASPAFYERVVKFFGKSFGLNNKSQMALEELVTKASGIKPSDLDIAKLATTLTIPILVVHDKNDKAVDFMSALAITEAYQGARLITTEGLGHTRILKNPKIISEVTHFIGQIS